MSARSNVLSIARKEIRGYFTSAVALIFLAAFLAVTLAVVFWHEKFFARGLADVRPLFEWLPAMLIFLAAALSMRMWSEERKVGTIEVLMTLPVPRHHLVLGKFLAGLALVAVALALTLGLPLTVAQMGDLDWGPVLGGYLAAILLAGAYIAIGMTISSATDNQVVALIGTAFACAALQFAGAAHDFVVGASGSTRGSVAATLLAAIAYLDADAHFDSIARGVLDLRDLGFYASLIALFLALNTFILVSRGWSRAARSQRRRSAALVTVGLIAGNALALNLWLAPVTRARVDLTENGDYSLSPVTRDMLASLDQPLTLRAYFSEKTHPLLAPLVPQLVDVLDEYRIAGRGRVRVEVVDPSSDEAVEKEAVEQYGLRSVPFRFAERSGEAVVNAYFHVLVQYGDQYDVLEFTDLIETQQVEIGKLDVRLRNPEYDLTKTIKKVVYGFQSVEALFAALPGKAELTAYVTPATLPPPWSELPAKLKALTDELGKEAGGKLSFTTVEPKGDAERQALYQKYGFQPLSAGLLSRDAFYAHLVLKVGDKEVPFLPPETLTDASLKEQVTEVLKRAAPGFVKRVGLWMPPAPTPRQPPQGMMPPQGEEPPQTFRALGQALTESYEVTPLDLSSGRIDDGIEIVILAGPASLGDKERTAIDQFVMRGGALIDLTGRFRLDHSARGQLQVEPVATGLEELLSSWGIEVAAEMVLDPQNDPLPVPVERDLGGGIRVRDIQRVNYPFFVRIDKDGMSGETPVTGAINSMVLHWASPVKTPAVGKPAAEGGAEITSKTVLLRSTDGAWRQSTSNVQPDFERHGESGFARPSDATAGRQELAVALVGSFPSLAAKQAKEKPAETAPGAEPKAERLLERSPPGTRIVVVGSSSFASDEVLELGRMSGSQSGASNLAFVQNLVDWAAADTDLLSIRSRGNAARALTIGEDERTKWEIINYAIVALGLAAVIGGYALRRRSQGAMPLAPRKEGQS